MKRWEWGMGLGVVLKGPLVLSEILSFLKGRLYSCITWVTKSQFLKVLSKTGFGIPRFGPIPTEPNTTEAKTWYSKKFHWGGEPGEEGGNCLSDSWLYEKKLGANHVRRAALSAGLSLTDRKSAHRYFLANSQASLRAFPWFFKQKLQSLIKPPVNYPQLQLVSLKPLTRHSGVQVVAGIDGALAGQAQRSHERAPRGTWHHWGHLDVGDPCQTEHSTVCSLPQTSVVLPVTPSYRSGNRGSGNGVAQVHTARRLSE